MKKDNLVYVQDIYNCIEKITEYIDPSARVLGVYQTVV
jgi:uncharacterized protein with HEPN domain